MKFKIISLGCKVNSYECSALASSFLSRGYFECDDNDPDVVVINMVTPNHFLESPAHVIKDIADE